MIVAIGGVAADLIGMANLAQVAGLYSYLLLGISHPSIVGVTASVSSGPQIPRALPAK